MFVSASALMVSEMVSLSPGRQMLTVSPSPTFIRPANFLLMAVPVRGSVRNVALSPKAMEVWSSVITVSRQERRFVSLRRLTDCSMMPSTFMAFSVSR